ncbi:hypothetical protein RCO28_23460 [Streptomyces sp. LHD-70]|uniref:hypothetical protein n=1 Tax=Streptomyces sp. LHD-70 TaxID=3072140 RepID=UPI00280C440C|nr:hypothetical protein [Streptomyces sp. LHD-70]MDQ8705430.1 hypothetical protein [Streptomyces sp. LHD-70]
MWWLLVAALPVGAVTWAIMAWASVDAGLWTYLSSGLLTLLTATVLTMNAGGGVPVFLHDLIERLRGARR